MVFIIHFRDKYKKNKLTVVLYVRGTWSLTLNEGYKLKVYEKKVLSGVRGERRILHKEFRGII
jgi:hypothetical protein